MTAKQHRDNFIVVAIFLVIAYFSLPDSVKNPLKQEIPKNVDSKIIIPDDFESIKKEDGVFSESIEYIGSIEKTNIKSINLHARNKVFNKATKSRLDMNNEFNCMAANIFFEAANQPEIGQIAVAFVTKRRSKMYGNNSICDAVTRAELDDNSNPIINTAHFSWFADNRKTVYIGEDKFSQASYNSIEELVKKFFNGEFKDPTGGADHYCTLAVESTTWWVPYMLKHSRKVIGDHVFFKHDPNKPPRKKAKQKNAI